ncbi:MAG: 30S ribosomal protein S20 [Patescibacteria group bacterium]|nr:30S ribosomal protein S20 [Patescibacteria group bacterium]
MPVKKSAKKTLRKDKKKALRNKNVNMESKTLIKKTRKAIDSKAKDARELVKKTIKKLDKAAQKGIIKKNTVARKKSRIMKRLNKSAK